MCLHCIHWRRYYNDNGVHNMTAPNDIPAPLLADYLTREQAAGELHVNARTLARWRVLRIGPPQVRIGARIYYHRAKVAAWLAQRTEKAA